MTNDLKPIYPSTYMVAQLSLVDDCLQEVLDSDEFRSCTRDAQGEMTTQELSRDHFAFITSVGWTLQCNDESIDLKSVPAWVDFKGCELRNSLTSKLPAMHTSQDANDLRDNKTSLIEEVALLPIEPSVRNDSQENTVISDLEENFQNEMTHFKDSPALGNIMSSILHWGAQVWKCALIGLSIILLLVLVTILRIAIIRKVVARTPTDIEIV